eukprot:CAMPEP_0181202770 /NCGR_PEP_ID=MMETSP1096-20121128/19026_1 /TAXON_ID=156174 ORGANISM="Chrysochromulina ericina, Strain CCMP281" /NCGR_SAMPLE_ID=MMETSP1096 /ASSEMBLY_ACC=CAM_ASM_000453 /LENGTH=125 /DNA_ID=CAMNT_0023293319 /DNA_START=376 /DNA_END=753 /DNA_ORIENTATION=+
MSHTSRCRWRQLKRTRRPNFPKLKISQLTFCPAHLPCAFWTAVAPPCAATHLELQLFASALESGDLRVLRARVEVAEQRWPCASCPGRPKLKAMLRVPSREIQSAAAYKEPLCVGASYPRVYICK